MPPTEIDEAAARCRPAARPTGQEPVFRAGSASERNDLPVRNARFPIRASRTLRRLAYSGYAAGKRERKERERAERPRVRLGPCGARERGRLVRPGFWVARIGLSRQKRRTNPEYLPNPITHFVTPAVLGGVFGPYFPMAGNPLAWSRLENTCTWHIRYINAYDRSAKYFSIPKPG